MQWSENAIRVGLVGYGFSGETLHAPLIESVPGLKLSVIRSSKIEVAPAAYPDSRICSANEVTTDPDVDLVVIATPNDSHYQLAAAALRAGKDVVIDKSLTVTLAEARSLVEIATNCNQTRTFALGFP